MKKISVVIPTYNEEENILELCKVLPQLLNEKLSQYDYEIIFIDNDSQDNTRKLISNACERNKKIKAIFNAKNAIYIYFGKG